LTQAPTFISYSRRQIYFAESLALHLQNEGLNIWFDLQELQAGTVWADGLKHGVGEASQMVLVVSQAALDSPYTQQEWKTFISRGNRPVLVIFEPVELPELLKGMPTFDLRAGFKHKVKALAAYLRGEVEPQYDRIPKRKAFGLPGILPGGVWAVLTAIFAPLLACIGAFSLALARLALGKTPQLDALPFLIVFLVITLLISAWFGLRLLTRKLGLASLRRAIVVNGLLLLPGFFAVAKFVDDTEFSGPIGPSQLLIIGLITWVLFVLFIVLRQSESILRWMTPDDALQPMRKRLHLPLARVVSRAASDTQLAITTDALSYSIHNDIADAPFAEVIKRIFAKAGYHLVAGDDKPNHHIAILSNRSAQSWVQKITQSYAGTLVFIVTSTIEFTDSLTETSRYQWVDAREGKQEEIIGLTRSLADANRHKREVALEANPSQIDTWKVPTGIKRQKRLLELLATFLLIFGITNAVGYVMKILGFNPSGDGNTGASLILIAISAGYILMVSRALVSRKVSAFIYFSLSLISFAAVAFLQLLPSPLDWPTTDTTIWYYVGIFMTITIPIIFVISSWQTVFWFPKSGTIHKDEVGIKKSIAHKFRRRNLNIVAGWVVVILAAVAIVIITSQD
jgi:hypothetical protein